MNELLDILIDKFKRDIDVYYNQYNKDMHHIIDATLNNIDGKYDPSNYMHRMEIENMHRDIENKIDVLFSDIEVTMTEILKEAYTKSYEIYGKEHDIILFNTKMDEALNSLWSGVNYKDRLKRHSFLLKFQSNALANNGIVNHMGSKFIKTELSKILKNQYSAMKILSTSEINYIGNQAVVDYCSVNNIVEVVIVDDDRCCDECRANAGKRYKVRTLKHSDYCLHVGCRCTVQPVYKHKRK